LNTYGYVGGNPIRLFDPLGLAAIDIPLPNLPIQIPKWCKLVGGGASNILGGFLLLSGDTPQCGGGRGNPSVECEDDENDKCKKAIQEAQSRYNKLVNKRIPHFQSGGTEGRDTNHLVSIMQLQNALKDAIRRVRLHCKNLPPEIAEWERAANLHAPGF
jgi:predicted metal-binding protein